MCRIYGKNFMYNGRILTELKLKRNNDPNEIQRMSTKHSRPRHHRWQVYLPTNSDASRLNTPTGGRHDAASAAYKTCVFAWLDPTLGPAATALASEIGIDKKIRIPWLEQRRWGDRVVFTEYDAIERRCRANKLGNCGSNLYKLSGPAICEASRWGPAPTMRLYLGHCSSVAD